MSVLTSDNKEAIRLGIRTAVKRRDLHRGQAHLKRQEIIRVGCGPDIPNKKEALSRLLLLFTDYTRFAEAADREIWRLQTLLKEEYIPLD